MTRRYSKPDPLTEINRSVWEEIEKYKWIESEKAGYDIGWDEAQRKWLRNHFGAWKETRWSDAVAEALASPVSLN